MAEYIPVEKAMSDLLRASRCLYLEVSGPIADDVRDKIAKVKEVIDAQAEEIDDLIENFNDRAIKSDAEIERLKARWVTEDEIAHTLDDEVISAGVDHPLSHEQYVSRLCDFLRSKGLLIESEQAAPELPVSPTKHRDFIKLPVEERRKQMEAACTKEMVASYQPAETDPLKVDTEGFYAPPDLEVRKKLNALVDEFRHEQEESTKLAAGIGKLSVLVQELEIKLDIICSTLGVKKGV